MAFSMPSIIFSPAKFSDCSFGVSILSSVATLRCEPSSELAVLMTGESTNKSDGSKCTNESESLWLTIKEFSRCLGAGVVYILLLFPRGGKFGGSLSTDTDVGVSEFAAMLVD